MKVPLQKYWNVQKKYLAPFKKRVILLAFLLASGTVLLVVTPLIIENYINLAIQDSSLEDLSGFFRAILRLFTDNDTIFPALIFLASVYIFLMFIQQAISLFSVYVGQNLSWSSTNMLRSDLTEHCVNLDMTFHNEHKPGEMIEKIDGDINTLAQFLSQFSIQLVTSLLLIIGVLVTFFVKHWTLGLSFSAFTLLAIIVMYKMRNFSVKYWEKQREASADMFGTIEESLSAVEDIRANGGVSNAMRKFFHYSKINYKTFHRALVRDQLFVITIWGIIALINTLVFAPSIPLFDKGIITLGTIFLVQVYAGILLRPIFVITRQMQNLQKAGASIDRINKLFQIETKIEDKGTEEITPGPIAIEFDDLSFAYLEDEYVLNNISFKIEPGKTLGIVGHTGSGKTTISRLLFRLYDIKPDNGSIKLNDVAVNDIALNDLRDKISYVTQSVELFQASVRENISLFDERIPDQRIESILLDIGLGNWFDKLPKGLNTIISSSEHGISAGEAQLLALARVFIKSPNLVVLDEASSRLDPVTENLLERAIEKLLINRTGIIIAHRLSTLQKVDEILIIDKGNILEYGKREDLEKDTDSKFYHLLQTGEIEELLK
ncbi:MAG: ABC transporter ATP-binding protein [Candidatus Heimdallarchaeota archaeon]|nr:ABC transporter ATP-binding protein [Candidatus Heimdallarchaeota archaeon]MCK4769147.1 ABC transporter ATP-binding protein [Candidatus Heimdallarchaeota archaeon]